MKKLEIYKEFDEIIKNAPSLKDYLEEVDQYGQDEFVYYSETTELYDQYKSDCDDWIYEQVEETGLKPWELFEDWDYTINSDRNKFIVIAAMFEGYCRYLLEDYRQE
ncbi:MAG: hypothetical protein HOU59_gp26 (endogenous virus) [Lactobacillus phage ViSo-2018a]|uniref:Uncharacterized protein n=1 Tax=Lactobacillus phage ViSo-2018a TaxID=2267607 RepID=A0A3G6JHF1_9CAUD|nr:MAG: hypothetical protein HOU59_gp26 [Lactobacillus phage ViSo-2018a]AZA17291.1 MAG: hypothetical protein DQL93_0560 [Lactobacillus phage ViSo-2018a]